jgi:Protein of unknown function, DUF481
MPSISTNLPSATSLLLALLYVPSAPAFADKTDVIYMRNGDRVTCEIKRLERGQLRVSTDGMGTIYIEWDDIAQIVSKETYIVEMVDGKRVQGTLAMPFDDGTLMVTDEGESRRLAMINIAWIDPLKLDSNVFKRWDGSVSAGFDTRKADNITSLTASFDARRRTERFQLDFDGSWYSRSQDESEDTIRATFGTVYRRLLPERRYWALLGSLERNDELGIDLRTIGGAGYGRFLQQTGRSLWAVTAGAVVNQEQRAGGESGETNVEALLGSDFEFYTYDTPKTTVGTSLQIYPSLTESGRVRSSLDVYLRRELITDLFVEFSLYDTYDNEPPDEGEENDYGIVTSLGYTF